MNQRRTTIVLSVLAAFTLVSVAGCGGGGDKAQKTWVDKPVAPPKKHTAKVDEGAEYQKNERWDLLEEYFVRYSRRPVTVQKDVFKSRLDLIVKKPDFTEKTAGEDDLEAPPTEENKEELDPLKKFPADEYAVVMIITGTGSPAALLKDPKGSAYGVWVDTEVGNEQGVVESITQYEVVVRNPNDPKPVRLSARPDVFEVGKRQEKKRTLQDE